MLVKFTRRFSSNSTNMSSDGNCPAIRHFQCVFFISNMSSRGNLYVGARKSPVGGRNQLCPQAETICPCTEFNMCLSGRQSLMISAQILKFSDFCRTYVSKYKSFFTTTTWKKNMWSHGNDWSHSG